ncbi:MAG: iron-sulfur cluster assembly protein [Alistipes sp.]|jgi:FeS assembly SUF system protein|nr:iron-sulfur cluster assembly protein [Alistipes sp.]
MTAKEITTIEENIVAALKEVFDPEIPVNIYDLGLVYEIDLEPSGLAHITMTLTAPNCPMADMLVDDVKSAAMAVEGVEQVEVELTFEPAWDKSMLSDEAKLELGLL